MPDLARLAPVVLGALAPLEQGYAALLAALVEQVEADDRIRGMWLGGSLARGVADAGSDLDVLLAVADAHWDDVLGGLTELVARLDPVQALAVPGTTGVLAVTTRGGLRCDLVAERVADLSTTPYRHRIAVVVKEPLHPAVPEEQPGERRPDVARMEALVTEALRQAVLFPAAVLARGDWLLGQVGVGNQVRLLYDLFVESNRPLPPMGVKQWSSKLTPRHRRLLEALPSASPNRTSLELAMLSAVEVVCTEGRSTLEGAGGRWPTEYAATLAAYWKRHDLPDPTTAL